MLRRGFLQCTLALLISTSFSALADEGSKGAAEYGAFFESDFGWIQAKFTKKSENKTKLKFELEGFEPDDFYLISLVHEDTEMELAILVPNRGEPPQAGAVIDETNWPMDLPRNFTEQTLFRVRDATDAIIFEDFLKPE